MAANYFATSRQTVLVINAVLHLPTSTQRLHRELPLSAEELEDVFDSLDTGRNGYLTLEAFSSGFSRCRSRHILEVEPSHRRPFASPFLCVCHKFVSQVM